MFDHENECQHNLISEAYTIDKIGNDNKQASTLGVDVAGATFLMNNQVGEDGIIFAVSAYFRNTNPIFFQIWRPEPTFGASSFQNFQLIFEMEYTPQQSAVDSKKRSDVSNIKLNLY